jgi:hypothetical protein
MRIAINITIQPYAGANWIHLAQLADPNGQVPNGRASLLESTRTIIRSNAQRNLVRARGSIFVVPNPVQGFVQQRAVEIATVTWTVTYLN